VRPDGSPRLLFAAPSGERHEFGVLSAALIAASHGLGVLYLGPDLPLQDIVHAARRAQVRAAVIGLTVVKRPERIARSLVRRLPRGVELWVGGAAGGPLDLDDARLAALPDLRAFDERLALLDRPIA
jgi:hypothetical protein